MLYFDTSFLVPLFLQEATSARIERVMAGLAGQDLATSHWTRVEFSSLLAREVRMGGLDSKTAREVDAEFEGVAQQSFVVLVPSVDDFDLAKQYIDRHQSGLRAGDALHLAIAQNHSSTQIYSLDNTLLRAGRQLGLPMTRGI
ncbi:MAG TPA: type II toxin-antitoxin system VapC family toxin [Reyranella sp.]